ncbi:hypothetical protein HNP52_000778 [Sphingomonas kyeonggiensis]|uniref:Uncharacterized protein n=1 Tax=Sphingomonas kyeonggiensis TaxID=1268553 RepID=A0A7W7JYJ0_9SPHN|nr:hypothetical protein [Sphingomonas kyeonggiensis]MBB4837727.1 hypothetical protein [Sphingomonas kyeonggiensis]
MKSDIKLCVTENLKGHLDPYMGAKGFTRGSNSLFYKRKIGDAAQKLDLRLEVHPKDQPTASAALYPFMQIDIPTVDDVLQDMIGDDLGLLEGVTAGVTRQPIGFTSAKADPGRWYIYQRDSVEEIVREARAFIERWTMPVLDNYASPEQVVAADEEGDERLARDRAQTMRIVAAALVIGRKDYAREVLEKRLGAPGARRRFQRVFEYVERYR